MSIREVALALSAVFLVGLGAVQREQTRAMAGVQAATVAQTAVVVPPTVVTVPESTSAPALVEQVVPLGPAMPQLPPQPSPAPARPRPAPRYLPVGTGIRLHEWQKSAGRQRGGRHRWLTERPVTERPVTGRT